MLKVVFHKQAIKVLLKMPREAAQRIKTALDAIGLAPDGYPGDWKPLRGSTFWRLRIGGWRVICERQDDRQTLYVLKIGPRGDIYK